MLACEAGATQSRERSYTIESRELTLVSSRWLHAREAGSYTHVGQGLRAREPGAHTSEQPMATRSLIGRCSLVSRKLCDREADGNRAMPS